MKAKGNARLMRVAQHKMEASQAQRKRICRQPYVQFFALVDGVGEAF